MKQIALFTLLLAALSFGGDIAFHNQGMDFGFNKGGHSRLTLGLQLGYDKFSEYDGDDSETYLEPGYNIGFRWFQKGNEHVTINLMSTVYHTFMIGIYRGENEKEGELEDMRWGAHFFQIEPDVTINEHASLFVNMSLFSMSWGLESEMSQASSGLNQGELAQLMGSNYYFLSPLNTFKMGLKLHF